MKVANFRRSQMRAIAKSFKSKSKTVARMKHFRQKIATKPRERVFDGMRESVG